MHIDGRWSQKNPKRVVAMAHNNDLRKSLIAKTEPLDDLRSTLIAQLEGCSYISSTMRRLNN